MYFVFTASLYLLLPTSDRRQIGKLYNISLRRRIIALRPLSRLYQSIELGHYLPIVFRTTCLHVPNGRHRCLFSARCVGFALGKVVGNEKFDEVRAR